jgi:hypothetical protein
LGTSSPGNSTQIPGNSNVQVLQVKVTNTSGEAVNLNSIVLTASGTGIDNTGITTVKLMKGAAVLASATYSSDNGWVTLGGFSDTVAAGISQTYTVTYDFSSSAPVGTYLAVLSTNGAMQGVGQLSGRPIQATGAPVTSATITVANPTSTPTNTPVNTPTMTLTSTATPIVKIIVDGPYPNPVTDGPSSVDVDLPGPCNVAWEIFTPAFRKICGESLSATGGKITLKWDLKDKTGSPVANGLYYFRVQVTGSQTKVKILKVLVLH